MMEEKVLIQKAKPVMLNLNETLDTIPGSMKRELRSTALKKFTVSAPFLVDIDKKSLRRENHIVTQVPVIDLDLENQLSSTTFPLSEISEISTTKTTEHNGEDAMRDYAMYISNTTCMKMKKERTYPIHLKFSDVSYKVSMKGQRSSDTANYILEGVTGSAEPGEFLALMGPSGGGKTTLLNLLSGRIKLNDHNGCITYNDQPYSTILKRRIGFVAQDDIVFPHLTVRETLTYAALLRLPNYLTKHQKEERAMHVITELGLERCQDTTIGGSRVRGISGGERKRVCIGNEILLNPSLLFLDEPTSGLDSTTALRIAQILQALAHAGKTVITAIHQPSSRLFNMFDKLILLGKGSSLFFGKASEAMLYFSSIGCFPQIVMNPAEFLIDLSNGNTNDISIPFQLEQENQFKQKDRESSSVEMHKYLVEAYQSRISQTEKQKLLRPAVVDEKWTKHKLSGLEDSRITWWEQYQILLWRGLKERRHDYLSCIRIIQVLCTAIVVGFLWWHSDVSTPKKLQDQAGLLFYISVFWGYFPVFTAIFTFPQEQAMLAKERSVGMYKLSAYFIARNIGDLPLDLILPIIFLLIVYFMACLRPVFTVFLRSMLTVFLSIIAAQGLGLALGAALMDVKKATTAASIIIMTFMLSGGFFIQRIPVFISWIRYLSINYHTYRLLIGTQYGCSNTSSSKTNPCNTHFIKGLGLGDGAMEAGALVAMVFVYRLMAYYSLRKLKLGV